MAQKTIWERAKGKLRRLKHQHVTKKFRKEMTRNPLIEYSTEPNMIQGKLVKHDQKKLVIIFQGAGKITLDNFHNILKGSITKEEVKELHTKYTWFKFSKGTYADFLFIDDYFSDSYGWYMFDKGKSIVHEFNRQLEDYIVQRGYTSVTAFGSSKGGTGSLLYGIMNPKIDSVFAMVPQTHPVDYLDKKLAPFKSLFFPDGDKEKEQYFNRLLFNDEIYQGNHHQNTTFYLYTGIEDEQFKEALELNRFLNQRVKNNHIIINTSDKLHNPLIMDNVPFVQKTLQAVAEGKRPKDPRLVQLRKGMFLLKDKKVEDTKEPLA